MCSGGLSATFPTSRHPSRNSVSSLDVHRSPPSRTSSHGAANVPFSSRFANRHTPVPSQNNTFARVRSRLTNRNKSPLVSSRFIRSRTIAASVSNDLRMSTGSPYACTASRRVDPITTAPSRAR